MPTKNVRVTIVVRHPQTQMPWQTAELTIPVQYDADCDESDIIEAAKSAAYRRYPVNSRVEHVSFA